MQETTISLLSRKVGPGHTPLIIAEVGQAHDGSLGMAHSYINAAARAGADAVKFQTHIAAAESTLDEKFRVPFSYEDDTRYDYWQRMEFSAEQWRGLAEHCRENGLLFLSSPFSLEAAQLLEDLDVPAWKVASGELYHQPLLEFMAATGKPAIISSGLSGWKMLDRVVELFRGHSCPVALLQCTTAYPSPLEETGLNVIDQMRQRYGCPVGLSDHSGTIYPGLAALARGADLVEVHIVFDHDMFGPDAPASLTPAQLAQLCQGRDAIQAMRVEVDKDAAVAAKAHLTEMFGRSLAPVCDLPAGHVLTEGDLVLKKPGGGIPWSEREKLWGRRLRNNVVANRLLRREDVEV